MPIVAILASIIELLPQLIAAGAEVQTLIGNVQAATASGATDPTAAEWQAVTAELDSLTVQLNTDPT